MARHAKRRKFFSRKNRSQKNTGSCVFRPFSQTGPIKKAFSRPIEHRRSFTSMGTILNIIIKGSGVISVNGYQTSPLGIRLGDTGP